MSDVTLEILIKTVLDATGYQMNEAEAQKLKTAISQTGAAASSANKEDAEGTEKLVLKKRELMHVINALGGEAVPELAHALSSLVYEGGPVAGIFLLVGAFEMVRNRIKEAQQATEEFNKAAATGDFAASVQAAAEAMQSAVRSQGEYIRNMEEIRRGEHGITVELNNQLQLIAAIQSARQSQADAQRTLALAKLKEDEVMGRISETEAIRRRGEIEKKSIEAKAEQENDLFKAQQQERQTIINEAARIEPGLEKARDAAKARLDAAELAKASTKDPPTRDAVTKAQQDADEALEKFKTFAETWGLKNAGVNTQLPQGTDEAILEQQRAAREAQQKADLAERQFQEAQQANKVDIKALQDDAAAKQKAVEDNGKALAKAQDDLANANRTNNDPRVRDARNAAENASEGAVDANTRSELFKHAQDIEKRLHEGHGAALSPQDAKELLDYLKIISQMPSATREGMTKAIGTTKQELQHQIDELRHVLDNQPRMRGSTTSQ